MATKTSVSQIYITDKPRALPELLQSTSSSVKAIYPNYDYTLYNGETLRCFIESNFDKDVLAAFDKLRPYAYKADLGRYCLLFKNGGWYFDISVRLLFGLNTADNIRMIAFRDTGVQTHITWSASNSVIYAKKESPVFLKAIELIINNCKSNYYGINPLCPTGPNLFGEALAITRLKDGLIVGDALDLTPNHQLKNRAFVIPDGGIYALFKAAGAGDLQAAGGIGTNNYNEFWHSRQVYEP